MDVLPCCPPREGCPSDQGLVRIAKGRDIAKAQNIILELNTVLDMEAGGEVAQNLRSLYNFMNKHLAQANTQSDAQAIREVINLLEELNQSWRAITA